jgi:hypothetical protein
MLLRDHLMRRGHSVSVGKPERASQNDTSAKLNLFLYETAFDASLRNVVLDGTSPPPLWLVLRYLLTAFDGEEQSDSPEAHELLGQGLTALHELNFLRLDAVVDTPVQLALAHNPEPLKITFDESSPDLLSKLMQGADETYRLSAAVQVRPVLLLPSEPADYALLVGVDYTTLPPTEIGLEGRGLGVIPSLGARLKRAEPGVFEAGQQITLYGTDLHLGGLEAVLGDEVLRTTGQWPDRMTVEVEALEPGPGGAGRIASGLGPSAGELPIRLRQPRPGGRFRSSNLIVGRLRPVLTTAEMSGTTLQLDGLLLGGEADDVVVAMHRDGSVVAAFDVVTTQADQTHLDVPDVGDALDPGAYLVILRVNGQQARLSPTVALP